MQYLLTFYVDINTYTRIVSYKGSMLKNINFEMNFHMHATALTVHCHLFRNAPATSRSAAERKERALRLMYVCTFVRMW